MAGGYTGKILRVNLTNRSVSTIDTAQYEEYGGGHGIGSAIFWDLAVAPGGWDLQDGLDPRNVLIIMTSPLSGTLAPGTSRTNIQGIGPQGYPINWYTRSGLGGTFSGMLKQAGWDGVVVEGKADSPVWINIVNDQVTIEDASGLWGLDTYQAQEKIWQHVTGNRLFSEWIEAGGASTTMAPAIACCGPAGEAMVRIASVIHGAGSGAGQGGFGAVFGSKNLKAISAMGTGSVEVDDPAALLDARTWFVGRYPTSGGGRPPYMGVAAVPPNMATSRKKGCMSCPAPCRGNNDSGVNNDSTCVSGGMWGAPRGGAPHDFGQRYGVNGFESYGIFAYLKKLYDRGLAGPGTAIDTAPLPMEIYGTNGFAEAFLKTLCAREGIGNDMAEGIMNAAEKWGRLEEDTDSGLLNSPQWGYTCHWTLPGIEWPYGSLLDGRDHDEHAFAFTFTKIINGMDQQLTPEEVVNILAEKTIPYIGDPFMFDYGDFYSESKVKLVAWHRHYTRFWKQSILYCDWVFPDLINADTSDNKGFTPEAEPKFFNAVTGNNMTFADGMEIGRKIWNLDRAIMILQGRHRDMEKFSPYMHKPQDPTVPPNRNTLVAAIEVPYYRDGKWSYTSHSYTDPTKAFEPLQPLYIDKDKFEDWRTMFYEFEGWETSSGWPTRSTLEGLDLGFVADELASKGKLAS